MWDLGDVVFRSQVSHGVSSNLVPGISLARDIPFSTEMNDRSCEVIWRRDRPSSSESLSL